MLVLFINCHKKTEQGKLRFRNFYKNIRGLLEPTAYYGNEVTETVREYDNLEDYIYDEISFRINQRVKKKFQSLEYVIIDGSCNFAPWNQQMDDVRLIIRKSIQSGKKILCHGFGHFSAYFYLTTKFDKPYKIGKDNTSKNVDFEWHQQSGDLKFKGIRTGNSGIKIASVNRPFSDKSSHALAKGITLSSKFDYVLFDGKSGSKLLKNVSVPFSFYWKSKLFCTNKTVSKATADVLLETQNGAPIVFTHKQLLSIQGLCPQILKIVRNWFMEHTNRLFQNNDSNFKVYQTIAFQNKMEYRKALSSSASQLRPSSKITNRPQSSKFSTLNFEKPIIRCSGKYETIDERYLKQQLRKKSLNFGRSRMIFKGKLDELQIANYVQRQPSRPPSNYKFREVLKDKWVGDRDFINC